MFRQTNGIRMPTNKCVSWRWLKKGKHRKGKLQHNALNNLIFSFLLSSIWVYICMCVCMSLTCNIQFCIKPKKKKKSRLRQHIHFTFAFASSLSLTPVILIALKLCNSQSLSRSLHNRNVYTWKLNNINGGGIPSDISRRDHICVWICHECKEHFIKIEIMPPNLM